MSSNSTSLQSPKVGFVSLGCPKALVDSERILTQLRVEGYDIVQSYDAADVVVDVDFHGGLSKMQSRE